MTSKATVVVISGVFLVLVVGLGHQLTLGYDQEGLDTRSLEDAALDGLEYANPENPFTNSGLGFGMRIAGTYVGTAGPFSGALTFHADGTLSAISNACCGNGFGGHIESEGFGNWRRTGPFQIELAGVVASTYYDEFHVPLPAERNGVCVASERIDFAPDFESYTGELVTKCWVESPAIAALFGGTGGPLPNLINPEREPDLCTVDLVGGPIPIAGERLPAVYPACGDVP